MKAWLIRDTVRIVRDGKPLHTIKNMEIVISDPMAVKYGRVREGLRGKLLDDVEVWGGLEVVRKGGIWICDEGQSREENP